MTEQDYQALVIMSIAVWRFIGMIRDPFLYSIKRRLETITVYGVKGLQIYSTLIWVIAFAVGYVAATMAGDGGDILRTIGWTVDYPTIGYAITAGLIASGSAGLRFVEKNLVKKVEAPNA